MAKLRYELWLSCAVLVYVKGAIAKHSQTGVGKLNHQNHALHTGHHGDSKHQTATVKAFQIQNEESTVSWTNWAEWSPCTKSCGFGISIRTRECVNRDGTISREVSDSDEKASSGCVGLYKEIQTCNTQLCPTGIPTPRESQCAEFNNKAFMGRQYQWEPFINPEGYCELTCRAKGFRFYARLAATVADGTPCVPGGTDICLAGLCKKVGCDGMVGSDAVMDRCGVCRGDNSSCVVKSGTVTAKRLVQGYNTVLHLPAGATNINVTELRSSSNLLAIRTLENVYILNGPKHLASVGEYFGAGTKFQYNKNVEDWCPGQCFSAMGPIDQPLQVQILFYHKNPGIRYKYSIPKENSNVEPNEDREGTEYKEVDMEDGKDDLEGYLSDSREVQNDARSRERDIVTSRKKGSKERHESKLSLGLPKYTQSFTFGKSSMIKDRYRQSGRTSKDHRIKPTSHRSRNNAHHSSRHVSNTRRGHLNRHTGSATHQPSPSYGRQEFTHHRRGDHRPYNRAYPRRHETDSRYQHTDQRHRQSGYSQTDPQYPQTNSRQPSHQRSTIDNSAERSRYVDTRQRAEELRRRQIEEHRRERERRLLERQRVQQARQLHRERSRQENGHGSRHISTDRRHSSNLNIQKQPVFVNRPESSHSNRALSLTPKTGSRWEHSNALPSISGVPRKTYNQNSTWSRNDVEEYNRQIYRDNRLADPEYAWKISGLTECSASCGGGYQDSIIVCVKRSSQVVVTDENCEHAPRPEKHAVICNQKPCPAEWVVSKWSPCTVSCGGGIQSREVTCKRKISQEVTLTVPQDDCSRLRRPPLTQRCGEEKCFRWVTGDWSKCSAPCGKGERRREITCQAADGSDAEESDCSLVESRPDESEICDMGSCGTGWFYTMWPEECPVSCGEGVQKRKIHCAGPRGEAFPDSKCKRFHKPEVKRSCKTDVPCGGQWFSGLWTKCNSTCGVGVQTRDIVCMKKLSTDFLTVVDEENCASDQRPLTEKPCENLPECQPEWYMKDWGECSASCGTGYRSREVKCLDGKGRPSPDCRRDDKPVLRESCNTQSCRLRHRPNDSKCKDTFPSCHLAVQARLCKFKYYKEVCCNTCSHSGQ